MSYADTLGANTHISGQGSVYWNPGNTLSGAPGASGPGSTLSVNSSALIVILSAMAAYVTLGIIFRKDSK